MKFLIVTARFSLSGVPLAQIRLANALSRRGHSVKLIFLYVDSTFTLPTIDGLDLTVWNKPRVGASLFSLSQELLLNQYDVVFSAEDHLNVFVLLAALLVRSKAKISVSSRVNPFDTYSNKLFSKRWLLKQLSRIVMSRATSLTCVSQGMVEQYRKIFLDPAHVCVYNIVVDDAQRRRMSEPVYHAWFANKSLPVIVACGQLAPWKGFADLITAMAVLRSKRELRLIILGDGPQRQELQDMIHIYNLQDAVDLVGYVENPLKYFARSDVFVLSSLVEGMPNVLVEAMMCGCTPVATDCPTGPRELLQDGRYGYLVPICDPSAMASAIENAFNQPIPKSLLQDAVAAFDEKQVINRHFELLGLC